MPFPNLIVASIPAQPMPSGERFPCPKSAQRIPAVSPGVGIRPELSRIAYFLAPFAPTVDTALKEKAVALPNAADVKDNFSVTPNERIVGLPPKVCKTPLLTMRG